MENFTLKGSRILIEKPERPESVIELTEEAQKEIDLEFMKKWTKLNVFAVGEEVTGIKPGDKVFIPAYVIQSCEVVQLPDEKIYFMVGERDIAIVW